MKGLFAIVAAVLMGATAALGQVTRLEYFLDVDPGVGQANSLAVTPTNDLVTTTIPLAEAAPGFHVLHLRAGDAQGRWSQTYRHHFSVVSLPATAVTETEYFIDTDPGVGKAFPLDATPDAAGYLRQTIPLTDLGIGFHVLGVRSKDNGGNWSHTYQHFFYLSHTNPVPHIVALEYSFWYNGQPVSSHIFNEFAPGPMIDLQGNEFVADLSQLEVGREYELQIRAVNEEGKRSETLVWRVTVQDLVTALAAPQAAAFKLQHYPNPVFNEATLAFELPEAQQVAIYLTDLTGKRVAVVAEGWFAAGAHKIPYNLQDYRSGLYFCSFQGQTYRRSLKIIKQ